MEIEFNGFPKVARLTRDCVVTEKIDGTNASIFIGEDGTFLTGSKTRWITPKEDNYGFSRWANENKEDLLGLGQGHHFGEWWGSGCQRGYGLPKGEKRFSLFNVHRWAMAGEPLRQYPTQDPRVFKSQEHAPACCHVVPILYEGVFDTFIIGGIMNVLREQGSRAVPGYMNPEGIVIYHKAANTLFKKTLEKDEEPKSKWVTP